MFQGYAARAAQEIMDKVDLELKSVQTPEAKAALERVKKQCEDIKRAAESGWY